MFLFARPFQQNRLAGQGPGDKSGIECYIVSAVMTVTASSRDMLNPHGFRVDIESFRDGITEEIDPLAMRP